jgi:hypothetical protein
VRAYGNSAANGVQDKRTTACTLRNNAVINGYKNEGREERDRDGAAAAAIAANDVSRKLACTSVVEAYRQRQRQDVTHQNMIIR